MDRVASLPWNGWHFGVESVAVLPWNQWQLSCGISGKFTVEWVATLPWNQWQLSRGICTAAHARSFACSTVLYCDIADCYNQIYHHTVENQLIASGFPNQATKWVIRLLESTTAGVSRGVPIGPHGAHLIAEATLIPIDNSMVSTGLTFLRYADDILVFCDSDKASRQALASIASILDKQQRLTLQRHKTSFFKPHEFRILCKQMIEDRPISQDEDQLLKLISPY